MMRSHLQAFGSVDGPQGSKHTKDPKNLHHWDGRGPEQWKQTGVASVQDILPGTSFFFHSSWCCMGLKRLLQLLYCFIHTVRKHWVLLGLMLGHGWVIWCNGRKKDKEAAVIRRTESELFSTKPNINNHNALSRLSTIGPDVLGVSISFSTSECLLCIHSLHPFKHRSHTTTVLLFLKCHVHFYEAHVPHFHVSHKRECSKGTFFFLVPSWLPVSPLFLKLFAQKGLKLCSLCVLTGCQRRWGKPPPPKCPGGWSNSYRMLLYGGRLRMSSSEEKTEEVRGANDNKEKKTFISSNAHKTHTHTNRELHSTRQRKHTHTHTVQTC